MTRREFGAIVLAGGRSSRFGRDKLAEPIDGRPLLEHAIEAVRPFAREVVVVRRPGDERSVARGIRVAHDPAPFEGPLVGLQAGLAATTAPVVLVSAGDVPILVRAVIEMLLAALDDPAIDAATLAGDDGPVPFPMVLRRVPADAATWRLLEAGERRLMALPEALAGRVIDQGIWRPLDPDGLTVHDIDTPADLP